MVTQPATLPIHRLDLGTYERMVASGALADQPVELLEGLLVEVSPQGPEHAHVITRLTRYLAGARAWLRVQLPLEVPPDSAPEPDLALVEEDFVDRHPRSALLVVEVSVSSHAIDRELKAALYARAEIPVYWLVDVPARRVLVHIEPAGGAYRRCVEYGIDGRVPAPVGDLGELDVEELLGGLPGAAQL